MEAMITEGLVYYMALKHVVRNKKYAKAVGPVNIQTHQPPEGRKKRRKFEKWFLFLFFEKKKTFSSKSKQK